jgi:hypothetical protein
MSLGCGKAAMQNTVFIEQSFDGISFLSLSCQYYVEKHGLEPG